MLLPVQVTFRNIEDRSGLDEYIHQEAAKLERHYSRITSCRVIVERPRRAPSSNFYHVRIDLGVPNDELVVKHVPALPHKRPKQAIHDAFLELGRQLREYARRQEGAVKHKESMQEAVVKEVRPGEGYGFLQTDDGRAIYFHQASVLDRHFAQLRVGSRVKFAEEEGEKGPQASTVKLIHPRKQARSAALVGVLPCTRARA